MQPEGFRKVLTDQGTEGALLALAQKVDELSARVAALDTRPQALTSSEEDKFRTEPSSLEATPPTLPPAMPPKEEK